MCGELYIHELKDWPEFRWSHEARGTAGRRPAPARAADRPHGGPWLSPPGRSGPADPDRGRAQDPARSRAKSSTRIRCAPRSRAASAWTSARLTPADRNVEGVVEMMLDATQKFDQPLTAERLFGWHASLFPTGRSGMSKIAVGAWRDDSSGTDAGCLRPARPRARPLTRRRPPRTR